MPKEKEVEKKPYEEHRQRLRKRFRQSGLGGFHDYEVLELLLTYSIPRQDTKDRSKDLIKRFKSFPRVLAADEKELIKVEGIGPYSAKFIKIIDATIRFYFEEKARHNDIQFTNLEELEQYFRGLIGNMSNEVMQALYLDIQNKFLHTEDLGEGTVTEAVAFPRKIVESALKCKATVVIIAHNHPGGIPEPSDKDNAITEQVKNALNTVSINLQEHLIIAPDGYYSYRQNGLLE